MSGCVVLANCLLEIACLTKMMEALTGRKNRKGNVLQYVIIVMILGVSTYINFCDGNRLLQVLYYVHKNPASTTVQKFATFQEWFPS